MIKIGDFARLCGISIATLRHYDEEGLLSPCFVQPDSGYRYFEPEQLRQVHRILLLKELGLSLSEIREVLREVLDMEDMRTLLEGKRVEAQSRIVSASGQIRKIDHHLSTIEKEYSMPKLEVIRKTVPAMSVAAIHLEIPTNDQVGELLGEAYHELYRLLEAREIPTRGPCLAVWQSAPSDHENESVDAAVPIDIRGFEHPRVEGKVLPEEEMAAVVHVGPFSEFQQCHVALSEWLAANKCRLAGAYREIYHTPPGPNATTEVQYPIAAE
jgi:DNA-binding transcriptional MerR regulator